MVLIAEEHQVQQEEPQTVTAATIEGRVLLIATAILP